MLACISKLIEVFRIQTATEIWIRILRDSKLEVMKPNLSWEFQIRQKNFKDYFWDFPGTSFIPASSATSQVPLCGSMLGLNPEAEFMNVQFCTGFWA
jgi:hypothetical protein